MDLERIKEEAIEEIQDRINHDIDYFLDLGCIMQAIQDIIANPSGYNLLIPFYTSYRKDLKQLEINLKTIINKFFLWDPDKYPNPLDLYIYLASEEGLKAVEEALWHMLEEIKDETHVFEGGKFEDRGYAHMAITLIFKWYKNMTPYLVKTGKIHKFRPMEVDDEET